MTVPTTHYNRSDPSNSFETKHRPRIAFVVQRYGPDITGGSEYLCRAVTQRLARWYTIDILTSCARDYRTWENVYSPGRGRDERVHVYRFPAIQQRRMDEFNDFSSWLFSHDHTDRDEIRWLNAQGPVVPDLIEYIEKHLNAYEAFIFFTYLYYPTYYGLKIARRKAVLVPTTHDEPPLRLRLFQEMMNWPGAFIFNSHAELRLFKKMFELHDRPFRVAGIGVDLPDHVKRRSFPRSQGFDRPYIVFCGRIDEGKNAHQLIEFYRRYRERRGLAPYLVLFGQLAMDLPPDPEIIYLGYVSEKKKWSILSGAQVTVIPSYLESLSIVAVESLGLGTPILVNARSAVLRDLCVRSGGGLYYRNYDEFELLLDRLIGDGRLARTLGMQGRAYVRRFFIWPKILRDYRAMIESVRKASTPPRKAT